MAETQTLREVAQARTPFSAWLGVVLLFLMFGLIVLALIGPSRRGSDYEQKRAANRQTKLQAQREQDTAALTTYAWVDKNKGSVRIPIDRAVQLAAVELAGKKPVAAGPIVAPGGESSAAATGVATPPSAPAPPASPAPSLTPKGMEVEGHGAKAQPAAGTNPPGAAPGTQPGASASPAASAPPAAVPPSSPLPAGTATPPGTPLPVRGKSPEGQ
jgi:hypothetical protein